MAIIGFSFDKITAEKKSAVKGKINIKNNVSIKNVEKADLSLGKSQQDGLRFTFEFTSKYDPGVGEIILKGDVIDLEDPKVVKDIVDEWKKNKKIPQDVMTNVINSILSRCNIEALIISRDLNLPAPIPLPKVSRKAA